MLKVRQKTRFGFFDETGNLLSNINVCQVSKYESGPIVIRPKIFSSQNKRERRYEELINEIAIPRILEGIRQKIGQKNLLTPAETKISRLLAQNKTSQEIANEIKGSAYSVKQHNKSILLKIGNLCPNEFELKTAQMAAIYINNLGLLDHMHT